jgi:hypothetical protein
MAFVVKDRVQESASAPGTGTVTLLGAALGFESFSSSIGNGNTTYYCIADQGGNNWEVGIGTVGAGTLARTAILSSSNADAIVDFASGTQTVFCTYPAEVSVYSSNTPTSGYVLTAQGVGTPPQWVASSGASIDDAYFLAFMMG